MIFSIRPSLIVFLLPSSFWNLMVLKSGRSPWFLYVFLYAAEFVEFDFGSISCGSDKFSGVEFMKFAAVEAITTLIVAAVYRRHVKLTITCLKRNEKFWVTCKEILSMYEKHKYISLSSEVLFYWTAFLLPFPWLTINNPRGLRQVSTADRLLGLRVRIPPGVWMSVCCKCCVLSGRNLWDRSIPRPEQFYWLWCVIVSDLENSSMRRPCPALGCCSRGQQLIIQEIDIYTQKYLKRILMSVSVLILTFFYHSNEPG